ncbi:FMN-binding negative transcriptional regulator [Cellvibrio sp. KY-GH-1]|uniref:FMN-binding negative transcriptional regulator n=1 Tax=Cellvibrio sp. KY-GH-1 TaxID=2303332 RepID=UPI001244AD0B|nr:FMN-binding negative transcriptional regulator [Cellvibrio sp. KY-GH-1]QEY15031.1 FMN-binding negative transcriptional regulator [Cellvibrio sp. KY-GH-1]
MYTPKLHEEKRLDVLHQLIKDYPLGTLVVMGQGELVANAIPFYLDAGRGEFGTLVAHISRANPLWELPESDISALVIFQGPQAYISPAWYPSKAEHGKAVPTWNYVMVQASGKPRFIQDRAWLLAHVEELTSTHEQGRAQPWLVTDAPEDFIERLLKGIVGIEIPLKKIVGKWKVSKDRPEVDKVGIIDGLKESGKREVATMVDLVAAHTDA